MVRSNECADTSLLEQWRWFTLFTAACMAALLTAAISASAHAQTPADVNGRHILNGHVPHAVASSRILYELPHTTLMNLAIGLPLRNQDKLDSLLARVADPESPNFRHYLSAAEFANQFGPTEQDYQAMIRYAQEKGLVVTGTHSNRVLLDVSGDVAAIEKAFQLKLMIYSHPVRGQFYAPDREPSVDAAVGVLDISGLDSFNLPHPMDLKKVAISESKSYVTGSGPSGYFIGKDFRSAYAPGVSQTGSGQVVGLLEFDGFYAADVQKNAVQAGLRPVPTQTVLLDGFSGAPGSSNIEVILDIMMASYMAPGLSKVIVYEGSNPNDILNRMATDNQAQQLSSSWGFGPINATTEQIFKQYIAQGQSLLQASGDSGAYKAGVMQPSDDPSLTVVGGTSLTTAGAGGPWQSEVTWSGSGGGVSTTYAIPTYQQSVNMVANGGSTAMRNIPDVSLTADIQMFLIQNNGQAVVVGGTSAAAPLWAGFVALANQQAAANTKPSIGFLNPLIYAIGNSGRFGSDFNDITRGSNNGFSAVAGYDLTTGWGSPAGQYLINDLVGVSGAPSFVLSTSPAAMSIRPAGTGAATITTTPVNGFNSSVSLGITGLPAGVTAAFSQAKASIATSKSSTITFTAGASAVAGTYPITLTGVSGNLSGTTSIALSIAAPNFSLSFAPGNVQITRGSTTAATVRVTSQNGFSGNVAVAATGLPLGVTASFGALSANGTSLVTFAASSTAAIGNFSATVTGTSGSLNNIIKIAISVFPSPAASGFADLSSVYNVNALVTDGLSFAGGGLDGGINGSSTAYSGNLVGMQQSISGTQFTFGPPNAADAVSAETIALPSGRYSKLMLLATAVNGRQLAQEFKVTYSDGSVYTIVQNVSDWFAPQSFSGETVAMTMPYRDNGRGQRDSRTFYLYEYTLALNSTKTAVSVTLPHSRNVVVLAASLASATTSTRMAH